MKFIVYLLTLLFVGTAVAQNPTILQGNYITNVFGNSNFVLNPNAQTSTANVTNATRSTNTPLVATSEFTLNLTSGSFATWTLRAFDSGMKGQNCEARFSYRGFATATTKAEIVQNSLVVAHLTLTPSTDPRIASINFPCGDLVNATTFRIAQTTANMTIVTPNEIGGIYVGLATNMANVAQAEAVVNVSRSTAQTIANNTDTTMVFLTEDLDVYNEYDTATGVFTAKRAGNYLIQSTVLYSSYAWDAAEYSEIRINKNGSNVCRTYYTQQATSTVNVQNNVACQLTLNVGDTIQTRLIHNRGANTDTLVDKTYVYMNIYRFPSSSELVVTPERQNTFAGLRGTAVAASTNFVTAATFTKLTSGSTLTRTLFGKADTTATNDYSLTINNMPVGTFLVSFTGSFHAQASIAGNSTTCTFAISDSIGGTNIAATIQYSNGDASIGNQLILTSGGSGLYTNTSVANKTFTIQALRNAGGGGCFGYADTNIPVTISVIPLDQPSNSALYVEGPVKAAATGAAIASGYQGQGVANANNATLTNGELIRDVSTIVPGARVTLITRTLNPGNYLVSADISCDGMQSSSGLIVYMVADSTTFGLARNVSPVASAYVSNSLTRYLRVTSNMVYKVEGESGLPISGNCSTISTILRLN